MAAWVDLGFKVPYSICAADTLLCSACHYKVQPTITHWKDAEGRKWGRASLPDYCPGCGSKMETKH